MTSRENASVVRLSNWTLATGTGPGGRRVDRLYIRIPRVVQ